MILCACFNIRLPREKIYWRAEAAVRMFFSTAVRCRFARGFDDLFPSLYHSYIYTCVTRKKESI